MPTRASASAARFRSRARPSRWWSRPSRTTSSALRGEVGRERVALRHVADAVADAGALGGGPAEHLDAPGSERHQAEDRAQQGRLARAVRADHTDEGAGRDLEARCLRARGAPRASPRRPRRGRRESSLLASRERPPERLCVEAQQRERSCRARARRVAERSTTHRGHAERLRERLRPQRAGAAAPPARRRRRPRARRRRAAPACAASAPRRRAAAPARGADAVARGEGAERRVGRHQRPAREPRERARGSPRRVR